MTLFYDHAPNLGVAVIILGTFAYVLFGLRVYTRITKAKWGIDDWAMCAAVIPFTVLTISCLVGSFHGIGAHEYRLTEAQSAEGLMWFFMFEVFYCASIIPIKLSISFTLIRIFQSRRFFIYSQWVVGFCFVVMNLIALLYIIFRCRPVSHAWDMSTTGKCDAPEILTNIYYATTAVNIVTDWFCALVPIPLLWYIKLNNNAKISVAGILSLGILASLSACIRLKYTINLSTKHDYLYGVSSVVLWGFAENGLGMIVACITTLRPLFQGLFNLGESDIELTPALLSGPLNSHRTFTEVGPTHELHTLPKHGGILKETQIECRRESVSGDSNSERSERTIWRDRQGSPGNDVSV